MLATLLFLLTGIFTTEAIDILNILANYSELQECSPNFKMFDASGKLPSSLMSGNLVDLGNFDRCLQVEEKNNKSEVIKGKYCIMKLPLPVEDRSRLLSKVFGNTFTELPEQPDQEVVKHQEKMIIQGCDPSDTTAGLMFGWCLPHTCPVDELAIVLSSVLQTIDPKLQITPLMGGMCQTKDDLKNKYNLGNIIFIAFLVLTLLIMIASTLYDIYILHYKMKPTHIILIAFSAKTNGQKLLSISNNPDLLPCLNGIRFLSILWIILSHTFGVGVRGPIANINFMKDWTRNPVNMYIIFGGALAVDTFFVLSGLLIGYGYCLARNKGVKYNFILFYLHRYLRLTPVLAVLIWFHATIIGYFGSGPLWPFLTENFKNDCVDYWWSSLLYIQNYYNSRQMCLSQSWYLAVDMQLFILSPIILIPLWKWPKRTMLAATILVFASMASSFTATYYNNLKTFFNLNIIDILPFMEKYYINTHTRYGPWLMGLMFGYYLFKLTKNRDNRISLHPLQVAFGWIIGMGLLLSALFAGYNLVTNENKLGSSFFNGLHRHGWALGICWVIFACTQGYGGPVNTFLSLSLFQIFGRFTYTIYLVHYSLQYLMLGTSRTISFYSEFHLMHDYWGDLMLSLVISICLTLAYELPMATIEPLLFKTGYKLQKPDTSDVHHSSVGIGILFSDPESDAQ